MKKMAIVVSADDSDITVRSMLKDSCATCTSTCDKNPVVFSVSNPLNLDVKPGSIVTLDDSRKSQAVQGIFSLFFPIICAFLGYFLSPAICKAASRPLTDGFRSVMVLSSFTVACVLVYFITRFIPLPGKRQIIDIEY